MNSPTFFTAIAENITLLAATTFVYGIINPRLENLNTPLRIIIPGLFWGSMGIMSMLVPLEPAPGIIFDGRFIMIGLSGLFESIPATLIAGTLIFVYRLSIGGAGTLSAAGATFTATSIGIILNVFYWKKSKDITWFQLMALGVVLVCNMLAWMLTLPPEFVRPVIETMIFPLIVFYPFGTMVLGIMIKREQKQHRTARQITASEEKYRTLFEDSMDTILITLPGGRIRDVNQVGIKKFGYDYDRFRTLNLVDLFDTPTDYSWFEQNIKRRRAITNFEAQLKTSSGETIDCLISTVTRYKRSGMVEEYQSFIHDITFRKKVQRERDSLTRRLERHNQELVALNEIGRLLTSTLDLNEIYDIMYNEVGYQLLKSPNFIVGLCKNKDKDIIYDFVVIDELIYEPDDLPPITLDQDFIQHIIETKKSYIRDTPQPIQINSERQPLSELFVPLLYSDEVIGFIYTQSYEPEAYKSIDLTLLSILGNQAAIAIENARLYAQAQQEIIERRRAEEAEAQLYAELEQRVEERTEELQIANKRLQQLYEVRDKFVSNVSHELRTPITSLKLFHHLLSIQPEEGGRYIQHLIRETRRLEAIVEDILVLSRIDQNEIPFQPVLTNINEIVTRYVEDRLLLAKEYGLTLTHDISSSLPPVQADPSLLEQAIGALLTNAFHYTPQDGHVTIQTTLCENDGHNCLGVKCVGISVIDTGPGVSEEEQDQLFERFFRGTTGLQSGKPGTGLGLSIAEEIIKRHDGSISIKSPVENETGSRFTIWLPVEQQHKSKK